MTQPLVAIVCYDVAHTPVFAFTQFGIDAGDNLELIVNGQEVPIHTNIENVSIVEERPSGLGHGLVRKSVTFDILNNGPLNIAPLTKAIYGAGVTPDSFYFGVWVTDYSTSVVDIEQTGVFFGHYKLDVGLEWDEATLRTSLRLNEYVMEMYGRYNTVTETAEDNLAGSEWQRLLEAQAHMGYRPKVPVYGRVDSGISGYESYKTSVTGVVAGIVQTATLEDDAIVLGKSPTLASIVGDVVKLKFANGAIVSGEIVALSAGNYGIDTTTMTLNVPWDTIDVENVGKKAVDDPLDADFRANEIKITSGDITRIPSPTMYLKSAGSIPFYLAGVQASAGALYLKLTGIVNEEDAILSCEDFKDPANPTWPRSGVNIDFDAALQTSFFTGDDTHYNYAKWKAAQSYTLHFSNVTFVLGDILLEGMPWELIVTPHVNSTTELDNTYYIRLLPGTTIMEDANGNVALFYGKQGENLVTVPTADITSITYASNDYGLPDACRIVLNKRPSLIDPAYDNNFLYADTWPPIHAADVVKHILTEGGMNTDVFGSTLDTNTELGNPMGLDISDQTWTELLDSVLFESGLRLNCGAGLYYVEVAENKVGYGTFNRGETTETYHRVSVEADIPFGDVIDNTYRFKVGSTRTNVVDGLEFVRVHYRLRYRMSSHGGDNLRELRSVKAAKDNDRIIDYTYRHIADTLTAVSAAIQLTRMGNIAVVGETTRTVTFGLPMSYMWLQAMDTVYLRDFRHITAPNDPLPYYTELATNPAYSLGGLGVYVKYTQDIPYGVIPGVGIISRITYNLSQQGAPILVEFKQVQPRTTSNLYEVANAMRVNTAADNEEVHETPEEADPNPITNQYRCPVGATLVGITITPGEPIISSPSVIDPCCDTNTTSGVTYGDPTVVIYCVDPAINPEAPWPDMCTGQHDLYADNGDNTIDSTDPVIVPIYFLALGTPKPTASFSKLTYPGIGTVGPLCVQYTPDTTTGEVVGKGFKLGDLTVYPCLFAYPSGMYSKTIYIEYIIRSCSSLNSTADPETGKVTYPLVSTKKAVSVPITLEPVSDISIS